MIATQLVTGAVEDVLNLKPIIRENVLDTTELLVQIFENPQRFSTADLAYSAHAYLAKGLATLAINAARDIGVKAVGFTGGAACNQILTTLMRSAVEAADLEFYVHEAIPSGDGGVSFGQAVIGGFHSS